MIKLMQSLLLVILACGCATPKYTDRVESVQLVKSGISWDGRELPAYPEGKPEVTILDITIPPGVTLPMHEHTVINAGVLLKGSLTVITESGKELHLKAGDPIVEVVDTWHYGRNDGDVPAEIIVFYAGEVGKKLTVKQSAEESH